MQVKSVNGTRTNDAIAGVQKVLRTPDDVFEWGLYSWARTS